VESNFLEDLGYLLALWVQRMQTTFFCVWIKLLQFPSKKTIVPRRLQHRNLSMLQQICVPVQFNKSESKQWVSIERPLSCWKLLSQQLA